WIGQRVVRLTAAAERGVGDARPQAPAPPVGLPAELSVSRQRVPADRPRPSRAATGDARSGVVARLTASGFDPALAGAVANRLSDAECRGGSDQALRSALAAEVEDLSGVDPEYARYEVFVGPPGVGKTTTIAKIAAQ